MQADKSKLQMCWTKEHAKAELTVNLTDNSVTIFLSDIGTEEVFDLQQMLLADHSN
ncbi:hypothetical protein DS2_01953 [Catenovulum agarivorans DS-2]|uniref:Uncharacterized protein n=1 Tax=Catenovulum agarivorans DS-2 TaxID=1328313 RepID=W7QVZ5_9ALTE|nr:hypothetical protein [Catenovulum agarivorans]EWH11908.1 hypothetical protein DS2_01953 [Catenovulum agarivorans DS-2]